MNLLTYASVSHCKIRSIRDRGPKYILLLENNAGEEALHICGFKHPPRHACGEQVELSILDSGIDPSVDRVVSIGDTSKVDIA